MTTEGICLSFDEILDLAIKMEKNGATFYRTAAENTKAPALKTVLSQLAEMEEEHAATFEDMKVQLRQRDPVEKDDDSPECALRYINTWVDGIMFNKEQDVVKLLKELKALPDIISMALEMEKDSIAYYSGVRAVLPQEEEAKALDLIINHELGHVADLGELLQTKQELDENS